MSSSRPDTAATKRDVDSGENRSKFIWAKEATTYDNLLLDGSISNADVHNSNGESGLHAIPRLGSSNKDTDILISYLLTCDPPADVNGRTSAGFTPMWLAAFYKNTSAVKVLIDFGGDRTIKTNSKAYSYSNMTPLDTAKKRNNNPEIIAMLTESFPSEE
jgi:ankyrin repeat protein